MKKSVLTFGAAAAALAMTVPMSAVAADAQRYSGDNRYETAIQVAKAFGTADTVYLARGDEQVDAVAGGKLPTGPVLLVSENAGVRALVKSTIADLKATQVIVLGGEGAVSDATAKAVSGSINYERLAGANRYETAVAISKKLHPADGDGSKVYLANGMTLVDALVGGQIRNDGPILLTNGSGTLPASTAAEIKRLQPKEVVALGGKSAVTESELSAAAKLGKGDATEAKAKAEADLLKAQREAHMAVEGWYTVDKGTDLKAFATKAGLSDPAKKAAVETTFPKVLLSDIAKVADTEKIFSVDGAGAPGTETEALAAAKDTTDAKTYKGLDKIYDAVKNDSTKSETEKGKFFMNLAQAKDAVAAADKAKNDGPTQAAIDKYAASAKEMRIGGNTRFETAALIAEAAYPGGKDAKFVYGANGTAFADASVAGYLDNKAELQGPVVLVSKETAPLVTSEYVKNVEAKNKAVNDFKGIGGKGVISDAVLISLDTLLD
ncbi:cell wall-binding repeat-containing protein [uncultured Mobiluncus sp.]|uniref:cell wall-binding repeat-containing protein n=1 Tax=uncultured Mobiluncus sp. TaxID=293425 RepID=UPI00260D9727|nr:cell wall-binding repeat-containing protein [uncultured Mobiluncus sp.]